MKILNQIILKPGKYNQIWAIILYSFWNVADKKSIISWYRDKTN